MFLMLAKDIFHKMFQKYHSIMAFFLKKYQNFAKKEENIHESGRKLTEKLIFFWKLLKINDHQSITIYISLLLEKGNKITKLSWIFLWKLSKKWWKKSWDKCVFVILFFNVFEKYGHKTIVNLLQLFSKNCAKITIL